MMGAVEKEDLDELIKILKQAIKDAEQLVDSTGHGDPVERCRENVRNFHTTASMLGLTPLEHIGLTLEDYIARELVASDRVLGMPEVFPFAHAASALVDEMRRAVSGGGELAFDPQEIIAILAVTKGEGAGGEITELSAEDFPDAFAQDSCAPVRTEVTEIPEQRAEQLAETVAAEPVEVQPDKQSPEVDFSRLARIVEHLGGELAVMPGGADSNGSFQIVFPSEADNLEKIETLLSPFDPNPEFAHRLTGQGRARRRCLDR
jgi:chemotaxis protein histidine kinase CheA